MATPCAILGAMSNHIHDTTSRYVWPGRAELANTIEGRAYRVAG